MLEFKHAHFVGIGGIGMSGIAHVLLQMGHKVSGSDLKTSRITKGLEELGAKVFCGHDAANIADDVDLVVLSSAVRNDNPEVVEASRRGIKIVQRGHMLSLLMKPTKGIAIAGTHGKTTTSAMVATIFAAARLDPNIVIGGELNDLGSNARLGGGEYLVAEADESDASFVELEPYVAVVTSVDPDINLAAEAYCGCGYNHEKLGECVKDQFRKFLSRIVPGGVAVLCGDNAEVRSLIPDVKCEVITYGLNKDNDISAKDIVFSDFSSKCRVVWRGLELGDLILRVPGRHNIQNALAAMAIGLRMGMEFKDLAQYMAAFRGVRRRFQVLGTFDGVTIVDDYAHNPSKIKAAIAAAHTGAAKRVVAVFQPHRYTRTKFFRDEYAAIFGGVDILLVTDIYASSEDPIEGVTSEALAELIRSHGGPGEVIYAPSCSDIVKYVTENCKAGDLVLFLGAGDTNKFAGRCIEALALQSGEL